MILDRLARWAGVLPEPPERAPEPRRVLDDPVLAAARRGEDARVIAARPAPPCPALPDTVPVRAAFLPDATPVSCPCGQVWSSDLDLGRCWSCGHNIKEPS